MSLLFDRANRVTRALKSVEKDALNKAVTVENTYKDELFCIYFVLKLYFYKLKKLTLTFSLKRVAPRSFRTLSTPL